MEKLKEILLLLLPVAFLVLFLFQLPVFLPAFLLPKKVFLACNSRTHPERVFAYLQRYGRLLLLRQGELQPLEKGDFPTVSSLGAYLSGLPAEEFTALSAYLPALAGSVPLWGRALVVLNDPPLPEELAAARRLQEERGLPLQLAVEPQPYRPLFLAASTAFSSQEKAQSFELLFSPQVQEFALIRVFKDGEPFTRLSPSQLREGRRFQASFQADKELAIRFDLEKEGAVASRTFRLAPQEKRQPQLLLVSDKSGSRSFLEGLYDLKKVPLSGALQEDLPGYPLLVFDGIPLKSFGAELSAVLAEIHRAGTASLFFISDSPAFGMRGDNPVLEEILPAELSPRSLKYLPDLGILILLDISGSMMGEKLSLAKVSTLELIKNLKDSDRVSLLAFWDQFRFLCGFQEKRSLEAQITLAPLMAQGGTDMYKALSAGLNELAVLAMPQKHVIILTDGKTKERDFEGLIKKAVVEEIPISTLAVGEDINADLLQKLARQSGGNAYRVLSLEEIPSIMFEDRKTIARASFAQDLFRVYDFTGLQVGQVSGMSLFSPKPGRLLLFKNQYEDPLLLMEKRERQLVLMFLSDLYGTYTWEFFSRPSVTRTFKTLLAPALQEGRLKVRAAESGAEVSFTVSGESLLEPALSLYAGNRLAVEKRLEPGSFQTYSASFKLTAVGLYTVILSSGGVPFTRFPFHFNGFLEGRGVEAELALARYTPAPFRVIRSRWVYLILFFLGSVYVTFRSRRSRRRTA